MAARRPLTDTQREILTAERAQKRAAERQTQQLAVREAQHKQHRLETEAALRQERRSARTKAAVIDTTKDKVTPNVSGDSNLIMTTIFLIAGLIIVYQLVTRGPAVSGFLGSLGDWIHAISSNTPLFQATAK